MLNEILNKTRYLNRIHNKIKNDAYQINVVKNSKQDDLQHLIKNRKNYHIFYKNFLNIYGKNAI